MDSLTEVEVKCTDDLCEDEDLFLTAARRYTYSLEALSVDWLLEEADVEDKASGMDETSPTTSHEVSDVEGYDALEASGESTEACQVVVGSSKEVKLVI